MSACDGLVWPLGVRAYNPLPKTATPFNSASCTDTTKADRRGRRAPNASGPPSETRRVCAVALLAEGAWKIGFPFPRVEQNPYADAHAHARMYECC